MAPPGLTISIREKRFADSEPLFRDFDLTVEPGAVLAILGRSGVGKSTLLRMIAGIDADYSGSILVDGQPATRAPAPGYVFQDPRLLPWLTIGENIRLGEPQLTDADVEHLLARVELAGTLDAFPHALSGGMQRRAALARAMANRSGLILLDEPFVSLDTGLAQDMRTLLSTLLGERAMTAILVTHDPADAAMLADRVVVLSGRPVRIAQQHELPLARSDRDRVVLAHYWDILS